jgi:hypothetical protein
MGKKIKKKMRHKVVTLADGSVRRQIHEAIQIIHWGG